MKNAHDPDGGGARRALVTVQTSRRRGLFSPQAVQTEGAAFLIVGFGAPLYRTLVEAGFTEHSSSFWGQWL